MLSNTSTLEPAAPLTQQAFKEALMAKGQFYHLHHPFQQSMARGELSKTQLQGWVANRFYYQLMIPQKDAALLANCPDAAVRRQWVQRLLDHDGDQDIFATMGGAYEGDGYANVLFENPGHGHRWLTLRLSGTRSSRDARHARVQIEVKTKSGPRTIHRVVGSGGSFGASSSQLEVGLGAATEVIAVTVHWPVSGRARYHGFSLDHTYIIEEGKKEPIAVKTVPFQLGGTANKPPAED